MNQLVNLQSVLPSQEIEISQTVPSLLIYLSVSVSIHVDSDAASFQLAA